MSEHTILPGPDTARAYRDALGCFGTGVTVVTTQTATGPLAITANSFASVSLDPALVLWCPAKASPRHDAFITAERYIFHVMSEDQQPLATHFAQTGTDFTGIDWQPDATGTPVLPGCLARFACTRWDVHDGGDHSIIIGQVQQATYRAGSGLMFKRGQYGGFAGLD
ncbi:MAG: flavin reductase (DIM6/NTAB) family NADH-FMN oxidoreductase RutF [Paracoccaceae bacterium]|jgi:flavin reductase (DIM6/NTAB) family NADH-FMN oxidoreductase RutF